MKTKLGALLRPIRNSRHFTIKEVAQKAGISSSLLFQIERNRISPTLDTLLHILEVYGVPLKNSWMQCSKNYGTLILQFLLKTGGKILLNN